MREITITAKYNNEKILSAVETTGLSEGIIGKIELIGLLENLKFLELQKINTAMTVTNKGEYYVNEKYKDIINNSPPVFEIVKDEDDFVESNEAQDILDSVNIYDDEEGV